MGILWISNAGAIGGGYGDSPPAEAAAWTDSAVTLSYHTIITDNNGDTILPWYSPGNRAASFDHVIWLCFEYWLIMEHQSGEPNIPYYLMHMIYVNQNGLGGDQLAMAMSSWRLFYDYSGDDRFIDDMVLMADHVIANCLSSAGASWASLPYPYQTNTFDVCDGDMMAGAGYLQPDKAGSFGYELLNLYKITGTAGYLTAAINIANTLASKTVAGNQTTSPLPFRVHAANDTVYEAYTTNFASLLMLWEGLIALNQGNVSSYNTAHGLIITWLKAYPVQNDDWGPFFEDVAGGGDTSINAVTMAMYIMDHRAAWGSAWNTDARHILDYSDTTYGNTDWSAYGVKVINEQTVYQVPGQSHTSRQASMELRYAELTADATEVANSLRQLSWSTYMVDTDGKNRYPQNEIWLTDGYGDYVRHYLRAMAAAPYLAPANQDHLLRTTSVVKSITYGTGTISYETYDTGSREKLRVTTFTPANVTAGGATLTRRASVSDLDSLDGWAYDAFGGLDTELNIKHSSSGEIVVS